MIVNPSWTEIPIFATLGDKVQPDPGIFTDGYAVDTIWPTEHISYFLNGFTSNDITMEDSFEAIITEINNVLAAASITPNPVVTNQILLAIGIILTNPALASVSNMTITGILTAANLVLSGNISAVNATLSGTLSALKAAFSQATGTAPFTVASTTKVGNLNADLVDDHHASNNSGDIPLNNGGLNSNLNAQFLNGQESDDFASISGGSTTSVTPSQAISLLEGVSGAQRTATYLVTVTPGNGTTADTHVAIVVIRASGSASSATITNIQTPGTLLISTDETNNFGLKARRILVRALTNGQSAVYTAVYLG